MGKIKGPLPKFWILHLWRVGYNANKFELLLVLSSMIWDMEMNEIYWCFVFDGWLLVLFYPRMMSGHLLKLVVLASDCFWWFTAPSLVFNELRYGIKWALLMLCLRWLATGLIVSSHDVRSPMEAGCTCFWFLLMVYTWLESLYIFLNLQKPFR